VISPRSDVVAFVNAGQIWTAPIDGSAPAKALFTVRGENDDPRWSPDGGKLAFVASRGDHAFVGVYTNDSTPILWLAPACAGDRIAFLSYQDGWPHLYSIPASGGTALLLTPGRYMAEHISLSSDGRWLVFAGNMGDTLDIDRRHVVRVPVDRAAPEVVTPGTGLEWAPTITGDGATVVFISATAQRPPLPAVKPFTDARAAVRTLAADHIPADFPTGLVTPRQVVFRSVDGLTI